MGDWADLFMRAPVAIAIQEGPEMVYTLANPSYRQFFGNRELVGKKLSEVLPDFARLVHILAEVRAAGKSWEGREQIFRVDRGDGNWVEGYFNLICQPLFDDGGAVSGVVSFGFEVTDLVVARKEKEQLAADLEAAVRARDTFLAIASHELRTPLTTLQLQSDGLIRALGRSPFDVDKGRMRAEKIQVQAQRLNRLIGDLLDVSRITSGRLILDIGQVDLKALVEDAVARCEEALQRAGCTVRLSEEPISVVGQWDGHRLDQVLVNLITNAAKYGAGKPIEVRVGALDGRARVVVRDHGIGIDPADQARIFERFERAVSERNFGGLGLGLWISEQIVSAHGGSIRVDSQPGAGSTFTVELPL
jgi:signal transduction histidine kinase